MMESLTQQVYEDAKRIVDEVGDELWGGLTYGAIQYGGRHFAVVMFHFKYKLFKRDRAESI